MSRDYKACLKDILAAIEKIEKHTKGVSLEDFEEDDWLQDGVVRNMEIIGEAVKNLPADLKTKKPDVDWKKIAGLRDILIHAYFGIDTEVVWDIVKNKIPELKKRITELLAEIEGKNR